VDGECPLELPGEELRRDARRVSEASARTAMRDGLVIGYAAYPSTLFESGLAALGDFLEASLAS
jgi:hypothetical protein